MDEPIPRPTGHSRLGAGDTLREGLDGADSMQPPPTPSSVATDDNIDTRSTRSASNASRCGNRLSLTLPIAPPNAFPSRPTPSSSVMGSCPPTPIDTSGLTSPTDPADFITAVAAQERRVLELREELSRAEKELGRLKKQWAHAETHKKRAEIRHRPLAPASDTPLANLDADASARHSVEIDRKKALLLGQQSAQGTPTQSRRRVFQGGHTRTLSLLSPTKTDSDAFSVHEDDDTNDTKSPSKELDAQFYQAFSKYAPANAAQLSKRASWTPRSVQQVGGLKQAADDFRSGLWTFVEDLRQATVGDEPITGGRRGREGLQRAETFAMGEDQATIRASGATGRPRVSPQAFDETPTPASRFADPLGIGGGNGHRRKPSKAADKKAKHFSWTPLTVDSYDDNDWSNWDSPTILGPIPATGKSPRWSGSTVGGGDVGAAADENARPVGTSLKQEVSAESSAPLMSPMSPTKLAELNWSGALDKLSPSNIKRTATDLMKEFEKSIASSSETSVVGQRTQPSS